MKLPYVHLYSSTLTKPFLSEKVSTCLEEFIPFIDMDVTPFTLHSKKNMIDDSYGDNSIIQFSYENSGDNGDSGLGDSKN